MLVDTVNIRHPLSVPGLLRESQQGGLAVLLQHEKVGEPEFLRKILDVP